MHMGKVFPLNELQKDVLARVLDIFMGFCLCIKYTNLKSFRNEVVSMNM